MNFDENDCSDLFETWKIYIEFFSKYFLPIYNSKCYKILTKKNFK